MRHVLKSAGVIAVACGLAAGMSAVTAHHSATMFDHAKTLTINGTVVELRWVNPHVSLSVNGTLKEGDQPEVWLMEMTSPGNLIRAGGWRRDAVKPGERVEVEFSPLREPERRGGALKKLTVLATGEVFTANLRAQEKPGLE
jgi:saccharopine dehydrogenase-like NADP-dependent oxidoreductase